MLKISYIFLIRSLHFTKRLFIPAVFCLKARSSCFVSLSTLVSPCLFYLTVINYHNCDRKFKNKLLLQMTYPTLKKKNSGYSNSKRHQISKKNNFPEMSKVFQNMSEKWSLFFSLYCLRDLVTHTGIQNVNWANKMKFTLKLKEHFEKVLVIEKLELWF